MKTSLDIHYTNQSGGRRSEGVVRHSTRKTKNCKRKYDLSNKKCSEFSVTENKITLTSVKMSYDRDNKVVVLCDHPPIKNKHNRREILATTTVNKLKLPPIKFPSAENHSVNIQRRDSCFLSDVTNSFKCFRNVHDKSYRLASNDRAVMRSINCNGIKGEGDSLSSIFTYTDDQCDTPELKYTTGSILPPVIMSSLKLDNRHDMASNDHVRHHLKRQEQWIRTERLKNWRRTNSNKFSKKVTYQHSSSSGQKSEVNSGNSADSLHTQSSSSSDLHQPVVEEMDAEQKETIEKCLRWMEHLPKKFSGMHIIVPAPEPTDQS